MRKIVFLSINFVLLTSLNSQTTLSLKECIDLAISKNLDLKIQELNNEINRLAFKQSKHNLLPSLNLNAGTNYNLGYSISPLDYSFIDQNSLSGSISVSSQITLFNGFQQLLNIQKNEIDYLAGNYQIKILKNSLKIQVINLYLQIIMENELLKMIESQSELNTIFLAKKREAMESGLIAKSSYKELELQLRIDKSKLEYQIYQRDNAVNRLKLFLQIPLNQSVKIRYMDYELEPFAINTRDIDRKNFSLNPEVGFETLKLESIKKQMQISKGSLFPAVTFGYLFGSNYINTQKSFNFGQNVNPIIGFTNDTPSILVRSISNESVLISESETPILNQLKSNRLHQFQLNFNWELFGRGSKRNSVKIAKINVKQQEYKVKLTELNIKEKYFQAVTNVVSSFEKYQSNKIIYEAMKERYEIANEKYIANLIDYFEFSTIQNQMQAAALEVSKSKFEWIFNYEILKLY